MYHLSASLAIMNKIFFPPQTLVFPSFKLDAADILKSIAKYECQCLIALPKILINVMDENRRLKLDLSGLFVLALAGQHVGLELIQRVKCEIKGALSIWVIYASTECTMISNTSIALANFKPDKYKNCLGQPYPFVECKIVNPESKEILPLNQEGELHVKGYGTTLGYWNDPEMTLKTKDRAGWYTQT